MAHRVLLSIAVSCVGLAQAIAQEEPAEPEATIWTGEFTLNAVSQSGNTDTTDLGLGAKLARDIGRTRHLGQLTFDYGETDGDETKNRTVLSYQQDRILTDRLFAFGQGSYELDEFDGFDFRSALNVGLGYDIDKGEVQNWSMRAGPGVRIEQVEGAGETQQEFAFFAGSRFDRQLNPDVGFNLVNDITYTPETSTFFNSAGLTATLWDNVSARFSYDLIYETDPPVGTEQTDTIARAAIVFARK